MRLTRRNVVAGMSASIFAPRAGWALEKYVLRGPEIDQIVVAGGTDVVGLNALDVGTIVPDRVLMDHISDPLLRWETADRIGPWLATAWRNTSERVWELDLRRDVTFQNGERFDARAVKFFFDLMNDPNNKSPTRANHTWVARVDVLGDFSVEIHTREPYPVALSQLTYTHMMPPAYVEKVGLDGYRKAPLGTGAYHFVEHVRDQRIVLRANENWWAGKPRIGRIVYRPIKEEAGRVAALLAREVDLALDLPPDLLTTIERTPGLHVRKVVSTRAYLLAFNQRLEGSPVANTKVREAISLAIDRNALNQSLLLGTGAPAAWINPTSFGIDPGAKPVAFDPQKARALLKEAGFGDGFDIVIDSPQGRYIKDRELAEAIAGQLRSVGIRANVQTHDWSLFTKRIWSHTTSPIVLMAWVDTNSDPDILNQRVLRTDGTWSQAKDPELDKLIDRIVVEMNPDVRKDLIRQQQAYMEKSHPVAFLVQTATLCGVSEKLAWWEPAANDRHLFFKADAAT